MARMVFLAVLLLLAGGTAASQSPSEGCVGIVREFVADFPAATVTNAQSASASAKEPSGKFQYPAIFLHPMAMDDAVVSYADVVVPKADAAFQPFLTFRIGFRNGIPWGAAENAPNGVRFMVRIDGKEVFNESFAGEGSRAEAIDMAPWAGRSVTVEFRTNTIDGNSSYDWAIFGEPLLVVLPLRREVPIPEEAIGLALAEITCSETSDITMRVGLMSEPAHLSPGTHWLPVHFIFYSEPRLEVQSGAALLTRIVAAPFDSELQEIESTLSSPLVTVGRPFSVLCDIKNVGRGVNRRHELRSLSAVANALDGLGAAAGEAHTIDALGPGESRTLKWKGLSAGAKGDWNLKVGDTSLAFHVFGPEPKTSGGRPEGLEVRVTAGEPVAASVGNPTSRVSLVVEDDGHAYAIAEAWNGAGWQRSGSLYPLVQVSVRQYRSYTGTTEWFDQADAFRDRQMALQSALNALDFLKESFVLMAGTPGNREPTGIVATIEPTRELLEEDIDILVKTVQGMDPAIKADRIDIMTKDGKTLLEAAGRAQADAADAKVPVSVALDMRVQRIEQEGDALAVTMVSRDERGWQARILFTAEKDAARIRVASELIAPEEAELLSFYGPVMLAGDRASGAAKDFAVFGGLEYLEGDERSSSERDLAYPLSDRRVPAAYRIAAPVMAVQAEGALTALLWDANQEWGAGQKRPAARFLAPAVDSGREYVHMSLFAPSVGEYVQENTYAAEKKPYRAVKGDRFSVEAVLALDHLSNYPEGSVARGPHAGGLITQAMRHWFDVYGLPEPSEQPRTWDEERTLCRYAYLHSVWSDDPLGWGHCAGWAPGLHTGYAVPLLLDLRAGMAEQDRQEVQKRIDLVIGRAIEEHGKQYLWSNAGCHTLFGELPFYHGFVEEAMADFLRMGRSQLDSREYGLWTWRPADEKMATLGISGDHTLGQAAHPSFCALRAARFTGDKALTAQALEAMKQMEQYEVPRGAQMWECPLYQPDILAAAQAIRAYCEAYRLTGDKAHIAQARYWAWTGLPFLYTWDMEGYPTMRYNVISVIGSTFYTHSWLGLPVVWCGLVYAYAIQELAQFDDSFPWNTVAQGITNSAMWQQYTDGPSKGTYPDSWDMVKNKPNPADINPENIYVNGFRLRGMSPEIRSARLNRGGENAMLNSSADIRSAEVSEDGRSARFSLSGTVEYAAYTLLAPVPEPAEVVGAGDRTSSSDGLQQAVSGWFYDDSLQAIVFKHTVGPHGLEVAITWQ